MAPDAESSPARLELAGLRVHRSDGRVSGVFATAGNVLVADDASRAPEDRATSFLASYGSIIGLAASQRQTLPAQRTTFTNELATHVKLFQHHGGLPVFGGELIVHMTEAGITGVSGRFLDVAITTMPVVDATRARAIALGAATKQAKPATLADLVVVGAELAVFRAGLVENRPTRDHLAWAVEVGGGAERFQVWVDAVDGLPLATYALNHNAKFRLAYAGSFTADTSQAPFTPGLTAVCREDQANGGLLCAAAPQTLFRFSGQVYDMFQQMAGRDSYDGNGIKMRTVNLINQNCPNAYWDGTTTNYCPDFELDDVVAHEWGHAYTQFTWNGVYAFQSGALNESYSDVWGETVDLLNGENGLGGNLDQQPAPAGIRWAVGEDFLTGNGEYELLLRDMWNPDRLSSPGSTTSENYACGEGDGGGVHTNSGVPNHAYALLVDGTNFPATCTAAPNNCLAPLSCNAATTKCEFGGQSITGIGLGKAARIYFEAMLLMTSTSDFADAADALETACAALVGVTPAKFLGLTAAQTPITTTDCDQVAKAMLAVGMRTPPACPFEPQLQPNPPAQCRGATALLAEKWNTGVTAWTQSFQRGTTGDAPVPYYTWTGVATKPAGEPGKGAFAINSKTGTCTTGGDESGVYMLASPTITAPAAGHTIELRFRHFVETELNFDGGQLSISVNNGAFQLVPPAAYVHNAPKHTFDAAVPVGQNTNPRAGQAAWSGSDEGGQTGSWGTTVVNLSGLVQPGQTFKLRFDMSMDGCNGVTGWYLGDLEVDDCPPLPAPVLSVTDVETPPTDTNGNFTLSWVRPQTADGPDNLQQSTSSCVPALDENCNAAFAKWARAGTPGWQTGTKPGHQTNTFNVVGVEGSTGESTLTTAAAIPIPTGATALLTFQEWFVNEPDDLGVVEVNDGTTCTTAGPNETECGLAAGGAANLCSANLCWTEVYRTARALEAGPAQTAFVTEDLAIVRVNMNPFVGKTIKLRFRYTLGPSNFFLYVPMGWYLDNIRLAVDKWDTISSANVTTLAVTGKAEGSYCYRVATSFDFGGTLVEGDFSNIVPVIVDLAAPCPDGDGDSTCDASDNCPGVANTGQQDADGDSIGDACDACFGASQSDGDGDGFCNEADNCQAVPNPTQADGDGDGMGDACDCAAGEDSDADMVCNVGDNCPSVANTDQADTDGDGVGDACDVCAGSLNIDDDADKICNDVDNCPAIGNPGQEDGDGNNVGDACDCVAANDQDADGACNNFDNCPTVANPDQADGDADTVGSACDNCADAANTDQADGDGDGIGDACEAVGCEDVDMDGVCDDVDSCVGQSNPDQTGACFPDDGGCGCSSNTGGPGAIIPWLVAGLLVLRRRRRRGAAAAVLIAMCVIGGTAQAETTTESSGVSLQIGGFLTGFVPSNDHEFYNDNQTTQTQMGAMGAGFGARIALFPLPFLGIEADGQLLHSSLEDRDAVNLFGFGAHVIGQTPRKLGGKVRPFGLLGVGAMGLQSTDDVLGSDIDAVGYAGLGIAVDLAKTIVLRGDGRLIRAPAATDGVMEVKTGTNHFTFAVGISGVFDLRSTKKTVIIEQPQVDPDPDRDGIIGAQDSCPDKPENINSWQDQDGCPEAIPDSDGDGIDEVADKCPTVPEDLDKFGDDDGCPDPDNDNDSVLDAGDKCPIVAGPVENVGCPDADRDNDTVVDRLDNCPDEPGKPENHGCKAKQLVVITPTKLQILEIVYFQLDSAKLLPRSNKLLDQIAAVMVAHPEIGKIRVEGHTDDRGADAYNLTLSQQRAESVMAYLVKKGVDASRLEAKGFGETVPLDPAKSEEARAANRRVEFKIAP